MPRGSVSGWMSSVCLQARTQPQPFPLLLAHGPRTHIPAQFFMQVTLQATGIRFPLFQLQILDTVFSFLRSQTWPLAPVEEWGEQVSNI